MMPKTCDQIDLKQLLSDPAVETLDEEITQHLETCPDCVQRLESLAADASRWEEAELLKPIPQSAMPTTPLAADWTNEDVDNRLSMVASQIVRTLAPTDDPQSMGRIGGYEILGIVGHGAMGVVFKAFDRSLDRIVAIKIMNPTLASCATARQRFSREAKAAAGVLHANVISIFSVSTDHTLPYLVMAFVSGESLQQRLNRVGSLELAECLRIGSQVAAGLAAAHHQGLVHRDIKPSNIMLDGSVENAIITDFGLARTIDDATMTRSGTITGTPEYMSPEQAQGDSLGVSSDLFSLGSLMYAMATGRSPYRAETPWGVIKKIISSEPTSILELNPSIPVWYDILVRRLSAKNPADRPSACETHELIEKCLAHTYQPTRNSLPAALVTRPKPIQRFLNPTTLTGIGLMTMTTIAFLLATSWLTGFPTPDSAGENPNTPVVQESEVYKTHELVFPKPAERGKLVIDINRGSISVEGHDRPTVIIEVLRPMKKKAASKNSDGLTTVFAPQYDLDSNADKNTIKLDTYNQDYLLNLRIKVPRESDLELDTYRDGFILAKNIVGTVDAHSQHADITLLDIEGAATAYTRNGEIEVRFLKVDADAKLDFEGYNGDVDLTVPADFKATAAITTMLGAYQVDDFDLKPAQSKSELEKFPKLEKKRNEYQFLLINGGGLPLRLENRNGEIKLRKLKP